MNQTLKEMEAQLAEMRVKYETELGRVRKDALYAIRQMLDSGTLKPDDLRELLPAATSAPKRPRGKVPPKYRNPATGDTWGGQGAIPAWMRDLTTAQREQYLIRPEAAA